MISILRYLGTVIELVQGTINLFSLLLKDTACVWGEAIGDRLQEAVLCGGATVPGLIRQ